MQTKLDFTKIERRARIKNRTGKAVTYFLLTLWALVVLFPFYWMILTSVKSYGAYNAEYIPTFFTLSPTLENYATAFTAVPLGRYFTNTLIFTVVTTAVMLVVIVLAAFAFARLEFKGKNLLFTLFLSLMMIPTELVVITNFQTITNLGLRNTFAGLILPSVTSVFYIYLLKENFEQIPDELYKAARVDGTGDFKYLMKVMVPISQPTIVTIVILKIIECWNSYVWPRLITDDPMYFLVSNGIQEIRENGFGRENIPAMMAAVVVISAPLIVLQDGTWMDGWVAFCERKRESYTQAIARFADPEYCFKNQPGVQKGHQQFGHTINEVHAAEVCLLPGIGHGGQFRFTNGIEFLLPFFGLGEPGNAFLLSAAMLQQQLLHISQSHGLLHQLAPGLHSIVLFDIAFGPGLGNTLPVAVPER